MYVLDTNTLIYFFKGQGKVAEYLLNTSPQDIALPAIVQYEIETGIAKSEAPSHRREQFREVLELITVLPFDSNAAIRSAEVRAELEKMGKPIGPYDILIAGTVLAYNAVLVTHNTREFNRIHHLQIVDWWN